MTNIAKKSHTPHDDFFKDSLTNINIARDFLRNNLPEDITQITDLETLSLEKVDFIDSQIGKKEVDMLFSVKIDKEDSYMYVLAEHQSTIDKEMSYRLMRYSFYIYDYHKKTYPQGEYLPLVYAFVVYNGKMKYVNVLDFFEFFKNPKRAREFFNRPFQLVNISSMSDEEIFEHNLDKLMMYMLKHIYDEDLLPALEKAIDPLQEMANHNFIYLKTIFRYIIDSGQTKKTNELVTLLTNVTPAAKKEEIVTIAEQLQQMGRVEGIQKGKIEGKIEDAVNYFKLGVPLETISKATGLSLKEIKVAINLANDA
jgi:predicted transposase/invertase (TIGR01784 family)